MWIRYVEPDEAEGKLEEIYEGFASRNLGQVGPMIKAGSLNPKALSGRGIMHRAIMYGRTSSLNRAEREMIALVTSVTNGCHY